MANPLVTYSPGLGDDVAWNPTQIPFALSRDNRAADLAMCMALRDNRLQLSSLRFDKHGQYTISPCADMAASVGVNARKIQWTRYLHDMTHPLGIISYLVDEDRIVFHDAYMIVGSVMQALIKRAPDQAIPMKVQQDLGLLGVVKVGAPVNCWQLKERWAAQIAIGCDNATVYIVDFAKLSPGQQVPPDSSVEAEIKSIKTLAWHHQQASHEVLVLASDDGTAVLRTKQRSFLAVAEGPADLTPAPKDSVITGICWLDNGTSYFFVFDGGHRSAAKIRHLKKNANPAVPQLHARGILGLQRNNIDPRFATTVSREGKIVTWNFVGRGVVPYSEIQISRTCEDVTGTVINSFAILPATSMVSVNTAEGTHIYLLDTDVVRNEPLRCSPAWIPGGNTLAAGFGGKVAYMRVNRNERVAGECTGPRDNHFIRQFEVFHPYFQMNRLDQYCTDSERSARSEGDLDKAEMWGLIGVLILPPAERGQRFLEILGHAPQQVEERASHFLGHMPGQFIGGTTAGFSSKLSQISNLGTNGEDGTLEGNEEDNAAKFFQETESVPQPESEEAPPVPTGEGFFVDRNWREGSLKYLKELFLVGQPIGAIECAIRANDFGLAFLMASSLNNQDVMQAVKHKFIEFSGNDSFVSVVAESSDDNYEQLVNTCNLEDWKEITTLLITYPRVHELGHKSDCDNFRHLCCTLGKRFQSKLAFMEAVKCFLIAGDHASAAKLISSQALQTSDGSFEFMLVILKCIDGSWTPEQDVCTVLQRFILRLISCGQFQVAEALIKMNQNYPGGEDIMALMSEARGTGSSAQKYSIQQAPSLAMSEERIRAQQLQQMSYQQPTMYPQQQPSMYSQQQPQYWSGNNMPNNMGNNMMPPMHSNPQMGMMGGAPPPPMVPNYMGASGNMNQLGMSMPNPIAQSPPPRPPATNPTMPPPATANYNNMGGAGMMQGVAPPPSAFDPQLGLMGNAHSPPPNVAPTQQWSGAATNTGYLMPTTASPGMVPGPNYNANQPMPMGSTHPAAGLDSKSKQFEPWPIPVNKGNADAGAPCQQLDKIRNGLEIIYTSVSDMHKAEYRQYLDSLYELLQRGEISPVAQNCLLALADAAQKQQWPRVKESSASLTGAWNNETRKYIVHVQSMVKRVAGA